MRFADGEEMVAYLFADSDDSSFHFDKESIIRQNLSFPKQNYHLQKKITKHLMKELMNEYLTMELNSKDGMLACQK